MNKNYLKLYTAGTKSNSVYFLQNGAVYFYISNDDKYVINGKNLIVGATEILIDFESADSASRMETAVTDSSSSIKKMAINKFVDGMRTFSFALNVAIVLAKQVLLTNQILNKSMNNLSGDENKTKKLSMEYFTIVARLQKEYQQRRLPWLDDLIEQSMTSLTYKKGEAYCKSAEPTKITDSENLSDNHIEYERNSIICEENTAGQELYILQSGSIDVLIGGNKVATIEDQGTVFGEMALLLNEKRTATLKANNNVLITRIKRSELKDVVNRQPDLLLNIARSLANRHYYNIHKIVTINNSLIENMLNEEEFGEKPGQSEKAHKELALLKKTIKETVHGKEADFIQDLVDSL